MKTVFADTFYYLALVNANDNRHQEALDYTAAYQGFILTTSWVLVELGDALARLTTRPAFLQVTCPIAHGSRCLDRAAWSGRIRGGAAAVRRASR